MKKLIDHLLRSIEAGATHSSHVYHAGLVRKAFDAGALDCLVEHPTNKPPDDNRPVIATITSDVRRMACYEHEHWHIFGLSGLAMRPANYVKVWQELPPVPEVKNVQKNH